MTAISRTQLRALLDDLARRLDAAGDRTPLTADTLRSLVHLTAWADRGTYLDTPAVRADRDALNDVLATLPLDGTTTGPQYARRVREAAALRPRPNQVLAEPATVERCAADRAATVDPLTRPEVSGAARDLLASARTHGNEQGAV
ncbi:hypothetical protein ACF082_29865 [Streptomyces lydicus]|uniref:hypothetical protein n=1 Tax=Streptomyces lydicus TaxID=47763 RepID=UPI0036F72221